MGRSQRHLLVEHNATSNGELIAEGEVAPAVLVRADDAPASDPYDLGDLTIPVYPAGGPLSGSPMTGAIPESVTPPPPEVLPPVISTIAPTGAFVGDPDTTLTVTGSGYIAGSSVITFGGTDKVTTFISDTSLSTVIPTSTMLPEDSLVYPVAVRNADGLSSNAIDFTVGYNIPPLEDSGARRTRGE